ncbi:hypothetical protein MJG53_012487 [Ovis ammon polii x Ovis aries]|uniref:Uncharacterized protein n=1 Tax=Ovis ammon polii x Ovis aries TaxID=2918886 RepID=A0ACB9UNA4_9CETA|nr:hypothetical protein MJG53_012487 [Ovis ammon polii x Ovis aries]
MDTSVLLQDTNHRAGEDAQAAIPAGVSGPLDPGLIEEDLDHTQGPPRSDLPRFLSVSVGPPPTVLRRGRPLPMAPLGLICTLKVIPYSPAEPVIQGERTNSKNNLENKPTFSRAAAPMWVKIQGQKRNVLGLVYRSGGGMAAWMRESPTTKEEGNDIKVSEQNRKEFINLEQTAYVSQRLKRRAPLKKPENPVPRVMIQQETTRLPLAIDSTEYS